MYNTILIFCLFLSNPNTLSLLSNPHTFTLIFHLLTITLNYSPNIPLKALAPSVAGMKRSANTPLSAAKKRSRATLSQPDTENISAVSTPSQKAATSKTADGSNRRLRTRTPLSTVSHN